MFKKDFVWGTATAATQIEGGSKEGGKGLSVWDVYPSIDGFSVDGDTVDITCDHYHKYKEDVALMKELGVKGYRFSIAWTRILPDGIGEIKQEGIDYYNNLINELLDNGITPYVTIFHWDLPFELYKKGGVLSPDFPIWFKEYTRILAENFADRVKYFITLNEPMCIINGNSTTYKAEYSIKEKLQMIHNLLLAHGEAAKVLHSFPDVKVGYAPCVFPSIPVDDEKENIEAARKKMFSINHGSIWDVSLWSDPVILGDYPKDYYEVYSDFERPNITKEQLAIISEPLDFYCQNIYAASAVVKSDGKGGTVNVAMPVGTPKTLMDWHVTPKVIYWAPKFLYERYKLPFYISENGCAVTDIITPDNKVHDGARTEFIRRYLAEYKKAAEEGVDACGYFYWSFLDNLEWELGFSKRFGLVYTDYETLNRYPKDSFYYYKEIIKNSGAEL